MLAWVAWSCCKLLFNFFFCVCVKKMLFVLSLTEVWCFRTICTLSWNFAMHSTGFSRSIWRECKTSFSFSSNHNLSWFFQLQLDLPLCFNCDSNAYNNIACLWKKNFSFLRLGGLEVIKFMESLTTTALRKLPFGRHLSRAWPPPPAAWGTPEQGYWRLIEGSLSYFRGPTEASVDAISCHVFRTFCLSSFFWNAFPRLQ